MHPRNFIELVGQVAMIIPVATSLVWGASPNQKNDQTPDQKPNGSILTLESR